MELDDIFTLKYKNSSRGGLYIDNYNLFIPNNNYKKAMWVPSVLKQTIQIILSTCAQAN